MMSLHSCGRVGSPSSAPRSALSWTSRPPQAEKTGRPARSNRRSLGSRSRFNGGDEEPPPSPLIKRERLLWGLTCPEIDTNQYPISADLGSPPHHRLTATRLRRTPPAECRAKQSNGTSMGHHAKHDAPPNQMLAHLVDGPTFEAWTMLAAMAQVTMRVRIGCAVVGNTYRHPAVLAKMAVTVDHLSGGRLEFGIGAGWAQNEHTMLGLEFGTRNDRADRLEESVQIIRSLWTRPRTTFEGKHYQLQDAVAEPKPVQQPHPPIWIGGRGGQRKRRRAPAA